MDNAAAEETPPQITWEEMEKQEPGDLWSALNTMNLYERLNLTTLTPQQIASFKDRLKKLMKMPEGYLERDRADEILLKLHDEETAASLLSQMGRGNAESSDAGRILARSGQAWLIPRLERFVFWDPAAEPELAHGDIIYETVAANAFDVCCGIVRRSTDLTPKFKDWFGILAELDWEAHKRRRELLKRWWDENRERMSNNHFRDLSIIPLWPEQATQSDAKKDHFDRTDFFAALNSEFVSVRHAALERIGKQWKTELTDVELHQIAETLRKPGDYSRQLAAGLLASNGSGGIGLLKKALDDPDAEVRACASMALMGTTQPTEAERKRYLREIVGSLGYEAETSRGCVGSNYL